MSARINRTIWPLLDQLLDEALELPIEYRARWIDALEPKYAPLKETLRRLLSHPPATADENFLRRLPRIDSFARRERDSRCNSLVGPYRLIREIGNGGMASVWLAERTDALVNRPVALKLPHLAWRHAKLPERMARERDILAALNHANIATLYDAGTTPDGQPYLALEYVEGEPIDIYCRTQALSIRATLILFLQVIRAVAHAHGKLIVHRDLKPSNILVTPAGEVRLLDFGIAKLLEDSTQTNRLTELTGQALTPNYAAPEQIHGEPLTVAADIYALGVVLYELLTSARPYQLERDSRGALEDAIANIEPRKPSDAAPTNARKALRGDLDTIILKALKKNPHERYATAHALAEDIERYLDRRPVLAQPDRWHYVGRRLLARHQVAVSASVIVLLSVLIGGAIALREAHAANLAKERAEKVKTFLTSLLQNANPYAIDSQPRSVEEWLIKSSDEVDRRSDLSPELRIEAMTILGTGLLNSQNTAAAENALKRAVAHATEELSFDHVLSIHARTAFATVLRFRGRTAQLRTELDQLLPALQVHPGPYPEDLPMTLRNKTHLELDQGHYSEAELFAREELAVANRTFGSEHPETMTALMMVALAVQQSRDPIFALQTTEQTYHTVLARYRDDPRHPRVIEAERLYGCALANAGQLASGLDHIQSAIKNASAVFGEESRMAGLYSVDLARTELKQGLFSQALTHSRHAAQNVARHADMNSHRYGAALAVQGEALLASGRDSDAAISLQQALQILTDTLGPTHPLTLSTAANLARAQQLTARAKLP